jgi:hypothetical protein
MVDLVVMTLVLAGVMTLGGRRERPRKIDPDQPLC